MNSAPAYQKYAGVFVGKTNRLYDDPTVLTTGETCIYKRTQAIMQYSNGIARLTASANLSFKAGKKL